MLLQSNHEINCTTIVEITREVICMYQNHELQMSTNISISANPGKFTSTKMIETTVYMDNICDDFTIFLFVR